MLLVLWVIRLLNGAGITPRGQEVGFDCIIEFCFCPPSSFFQEAERKILLFAADRSGSRSVSSVPVGSQGFFRTWVTMATLSRKWVSLQNVWVCVYVECEYVCGGAFLYVFWCLCPQSTTPLCCAVTCNQISQRIYHLVNCLWVVDKMAPIHSHMKMRRG